MNDKMNELVQFSQFSGKLFLEEIPGVTSKKIEHENDVHAADGRDRDMYAYAPKSGCPDPKQNQVLMVLRDENDEESAQKLLDSLGIAELAENEHFLVLFPNTVNGKWNYTNDPSEENDADYLVRCFGALRSSKIGVNGFNGMIFYIATSESSSALLMNMAATKPINVPAMMIGKFPDGYEVPGNALNVEVAAFVSDNDVASEYIINANGISGEFDEDDVTTYFGTNPNVRLLTTTRPISKETVEIAWDRLFSKSRRWQNDTHGTYQVRTDFTTRGFTAHVKDTSLGVNNNFPHTWYEYIPPRLRGTDEKVPLVFYFHGVNCVPLYGAEQSNWHDIADKENFIVVYPAPAVNKAWNIFNDPSLPNDFDFVMALIEHMKGVHPIDETRIYATGFSMGGMMTHALTGAYPNIFAAGAPCNAFDFAYFKKPNQVLTGIVKGADTQKLSHESLQKTMADKRKAEKDYRMPIFQNAGLVDSTICTWPVDDTTDDVRTSTINRWKKYNNISCENALDASTLTGLKADEGFFEDEKERFYHQRWRSEDKGNPALFELLTAKRMPHAIDPVQIEYAWKFIKKFSRMPDGSLKIDE
jgi:poly(3-hydroxybutyrate) depolymerase